MQNMDDILDAAFAKAGVSVKTRLAVADDARMRALADTKKYTGIAEIDSQHWRDLVAMKIVHGYGVEDIAIWLGCHLSRVRSEVARLRSTGRLAAWFAK